MLTNNSSNDDEDSSMTEIVESEGCWIIFHQRRQLHCQEDVSSDDGGSDSDI